jgi:nicotinate-nucleotide--dimethylbenzimidazole phosphoribosyltransferase
VAGLVRAKVAAGSADLSAGPALSAAEVEAALDVGARLAAEQADAGCRTLVAGEMGIGNTTAAAAVVAALTGRPADEVTGRGTGIDDATLVHKEAVVARAVARLAPGAGGRAVLAEVGGLEIAALAGLLVGAAARRVPVVLDGVITLAAALAAADLAPASVDYWIAGHRPVEPGGRAALDHLGLRPVLDLGLRLGEGTGALLALPIVQAAARILAEVATLDEVLGGR